jgi:hypothetical protein
MKLLKLASLSLAAGVALGAYSAKAASAIGVTTNYSKLNVSGTITTNMPVTSSGSSWKNGTKTVKYGNKQLLDLFAEWNGIEDRSTDADWKSAKLVIGWDWGYDVLVVDKTGTNVLFDASYGVSGEGDEYAYFYVDFWDEYGVGKVSYVSANPGHYAVTDTGTAYYVLYDDGISLDYTDIWGYGGNTQKFKQTWDSAGAYKNWSDSEKAKFLFSGDQMFQNVGWDVTSTANISASGSGTGYNEIGWAD